MSLRCQFCGKDWVQGCWTKAEAYTCGNNDGTVAPKITPPPLPKRLQSQIDRQTLKLAELMRKAREYRQAHEDKP